LFLRGLTETRGTNTGLLLGVSGMIDSLSAQMLIVFRDVLGSGVTLREAGAKGTVGRCEQQPRHELYFEVYRLTALEEHASASPYRKQ
jgi:hypothetical protein